MSRVRRDIEAMADLLLGPSPTPPPDRVSALIEGNLPSRGDGWRAAAAALIAGNNSATLLQSRFGVLDTLHLGGAPAPAATLEALLEGAGPGHRWVVSMGGVIDPAACAGVDEIALVTGVDEAAIVAAYALLKRIISERAGPLPRVSLVLAGTGAFDAGDRFVQTARARLGVEPVVAGCLPEPDTSHHSWQRMELPAGGMEAVLATLIAAAGSRTAAAAAPPVTASAPPAPPAPSAPQVHAPAEPAMTAAETAHAEVSGVRGVPEAPGVPEVSEVPGVPGVSGASGASGGQPLPAGLTPLGITCPVAGGVVFASDPQGALHVVAPASLLADLVAAIGWAAQHAAMLPGAGTIQGHVLVGDVHSATVLASGPWPVHLVIDGPQGPVVLPAAGRALSVGPSGSTVPGWPTPPS